MTRRAQLAREECTDKEGKGRCAMGSMRTLQEVHAHNLRGWFGVFCEENFRSRILAQRDDGCDNRDQRKEKGRRRIAWIVRLHTSWFHTKHLSQGRNSIEGPKFFIDSKLLLMGAYNALSNERTTLD